MRSITIYCVAALLSLAAIPASAKDASPQLSWNDEDLVGCDTNFSSAKPDEHHHCDNGDYLTIRVKAGTPTVVRHTGARTLEKVSIPAEQSVQSVTKPAPPRALASGEQFNCQYDNHQSPRYMMCWINSNPSMPTSGTDLHYYSLQGLLLPSAPNYQQATTSVQVGSSVDDRLRVASFNARHSGEMEHEATSEAVIRHTADGGVYAASYQKPQSIWPAIMGVVAIELAGGVSNRIAYGGNGGYSYGLSIPSGPYLPGGSRGGQPRNGF